MSLIHLRKLGPLRRTNERRETPAREVLPGPGIGTAIASETGTGGVAETGKANPSRRGILSSDCRTMRQCRDFKDTQLQSKLLADTVHLSHCFPGPRCKRSLATSASEVTSKYGASCSLHLTPPADNIGAYDGHYALIVPLCDECYSPGNYITEWILVETAESTHSRVGRVSKARMPSCSGLARSIYRIQSQANQRPADAGA